MTPEQNAELVTIAEAAKALGLDPRQVRRYAARLQPPDRTQDRTPPLRVRLGAVEALRHAQKGGRTRDRTGVLVSSREVTLLHQLVAEKDARLREMGATIEDLRRLTARLEADNEELRLRLPPAPVAGQDTGQDHVSECPTSGPEEPNLSVETRQDTGQDHVSSVLSEAPADAPAQDPAPAARRPWWRPWGRKAR